MAADTRTDAWTICNWMQPFDKDMNPDDSEWWAAGHRACEWEYTPRILDLDALHEVEERLTGEQCSRYEREVYFEMQRQKTHKVPCSSYLWHATAKQKITALAAVLRAQCARCKGAGQVQYCFSGLDEDESGYTKCPDCKGTGASDA